jgi:hypothetical protein
MIISFIISIWYGLIWLLTSPLRLLPNASIPANITAAVGSANTYLSAIDFIFPIDIFITIFGMLVSVEISLMLYKVIMWVIKKIPGIN